MSRFRETGGFGPSAQLWLTREYKRGADSLTAECSEGCPDRLYTDKRRMDSLCDTDAVQCVPPGPSIAPVRPLFSL